MPTDVTSAFEKAHSLNIGWSESEVRDLANAIAKANPGSNVDWDSGCGEEWASVLGHRRLMAIVWTGGPLVILKSGVARSNGDCRPIQWIEFRDWQKKDFSIDRARIDEFFGTQRWVAEINPDSFSAEDLWWTTV